uniref:Cyclin N-terminal domain-containing protein n=1 Tax=Neobodo designis TaxID=312471 RepID=A0A6U4QCD4_NEODS|mmetsp:Transcript_17959/g.55793  ORF Transcript_17959/g.55793 Transcript_17959/m.55793 type:complete len:353 (+) Transcript_17959:865-1923(+)
MLADPVDVTAAAALDAEQRRCEANAAHIVSSVNPFKRCANGTTASNSKTNAPSAAVTPFHSLDVLPFSLARLNDAMSHPTWDLDGHTALMAIALMRRYEAASGIPVTPHMMHRLFIAATIVVCKSHLDRRPSMEAFAFACGCEPVELAALELALIKALDWRVLVTAADVAAVVSNKHGSSPSVPAPRVVAPRPQPQRVPPSPRRNHGRWSQAPASAIALGTASLHHGHHHQQQRHGNHGNHRAQPPPQALPVPPPYATHVRRGSACSMSASSAAGCSGNSRYLPMEAAPSFTSPSVMSVYVGGPSPVVPTCGNLCLPPAHLPQQMQPHLTQSPAAMACFFSSPPSPQDGRTW